MRLHPLSIPMLCGEALEDGVCVRRETNLERAVLLVAPPSKTTTSRSTDGDEARERVDQLVPFLEPGRAEDVVTVEQVERRLRHRAAFSPRR